MALMVVLRTTTPVGALVPDFEGQMVVDTTNNLVYIAYGLTNADWQEVGSGGGGDAVADSFTRVGTTKSWDTDVEQWFRYDGVEGGDTLTPTLSGLGSDNMRELFLTINVSTGTTFILGLPGISGAPTVTYNDAVGSDPDQTGFGNLTLVTVAGKRYSYHIRYTVTGSSDFVDVTKISHVT